MVKKTVTWHMSKKDKIKFDEDEFLIDIGKELIEKNESLKKKLPRGTIVEVEIKEVEIEGKKEEQVVELKVLEKKETVKEEVKTETKVETKTKPDIKGESKTQKLSTTPETKKEEKKETQIITKEINYVSPYGVKFVDENNWTNFTKELQAKDFKKFGAVAGNVIETSMEDGKIVSFKVVETKKEGTKKDNQSTQRKSSYRDEESTDKRTASMNAKDIVVAVINQTGEIGNDIVDGEIKRLTKLFYETTKNL